MSEYFVLDGRKFVPDVAPPPVMGIVLPAGDFARILHDQEANDGKQRIGYPEVIPLRIVEYTELTEAWQKFWFAQLVHSYTGFQHWDPSRLPKAELDALKGKWRSLTKGTEAFTNNVGTDEFRDYISGRNSGTGLPKQGAIYTGGNVVRVMGGTTSKGVPIETLDGTKPPPPVERVNRLATPWLVFCATNVAARVENAKRFPIILPDGRYRVDPFPQLGSRDTLVPIRSNGKKTGEQYSRDGISLAVNWISAGRLAKVTGIVPRPYVP